MSEASRSAFVVANDDYADTRLRKLRAPAADARELAGVLGDPGVGGLGGDLWINQPEYVVRRRRSRSHRARPLQRHGVLVRACPALRRGPPVGLHLGPRPGTGAG